MEKKYQKHESQVKLAKDLSMENIQFKAAKRSLFHELNKDSNQRIKLMKFDLDAIKINKHEQKKLDRIEFAGKVEQAKKVTSNSAIGVHEI